MNISKWLAELAADELCQIEDWMRSEDFKEDIQMAKKHSTIDKPTYEESHWKGSEHTAAMVAAQIAERYGEDEAARYDPETNCFTFNEWRRRGFHVKKSEKGLLSSTIKHKYDDEHNVIASWPSKVYLFFDRQVEPNEEKEDAKKSHLLRLPW